MIKRINKIKDMGIYKDFTTGKTLQDFSTFNLIYGWNGSGKSTLTRLFSSLEKKSMNSNHFTADFEVEIDGGKKLTKKTIRDHELTIRVFNQDFVKSNIDWDKLAQSILLISEEKIGEKDRLNRRKIDLNSENEKLGKLENDFRNTEQSIKSFLSDKAKDIKGSLQLISTGDRYYMNYDKTKFEKFIEDNEKQVSDHSNVLPVESVRKISDAIRPISKPIIELIVDPVLNTDLTQAKSKIEKLLNTNLVSVALDRLKENDDVQKWVSDGLELYKKHNNDTCDFCGQKIKKERIAELESYFNKEYTELNVKLNKLIEWLPSLKPNVNVLPDAIGFYDELQGEFQEIKKILEDEAQKIDAFSSEIARYVNQKISNPFNSIDCNLSEFEFLYKDYSMHLKTANDVISKHNLKTNNFEDEINRNKKIIELHFACQHVQSGDYFGLIEKKKAYIPEIEKQKQIISKIRYDIQELEAELSNEVLGADTFNEQLHSFLGRDDISLQYNAAEKGYNIIRRGSSEHAHSLSEGEKSAIAFIYYLVKLKENDNKVGETIVVIDDPISSFDSNHLFNAFNFLIRNCSECNQLIVLTHNFWFFKLIRDWMLKGKNRTAKSRFYVITNKIVDKSRSATLENCNRSLLDFHSEYHFLFSTLLRYKDDAIVDFEQAYSLGNICRRLLESFVSFKYPQQAKNFRSALEYSSYDASKVDRIYWYVQKYSHSDRIEAHENIPDNLLTEGENIIVDVLGFIKSVDSEHYDQMESVCGSLTVEPHV